MAPGGDDGAGREPHRSPSHGHARQPAELPAACQPVGAVVAEDRPPPSPSFTIRRCREARGRSPRVRHELEASDRACIRQHHLDLKRDFLVLGKVTGALVGEVRTGGLADPTRCVPIGSQRPVGSRHASRQLLTNHATKSSGELSVARAPRQGPGAHLWLAITLLDQVPQELRKLLVHFPATVDLHDVKICQPLRDRTEVLPQQLFVSALGSMSANATASARPRGAATDGADGASLRRHTALELLEHGFVFPAHDDGALAVDPDEPSFLRVDGHGSLLARRIGPRRTHGPMRRRASSSVTPRMLRRNSERVTAAGRRAGVACDDPLTDC